MAVFPRYCAENKVQTGSAAAGGHRRVATRKTTGDLATRRGAGDPETRAEWMKVLRYGHLRSAPVVVDATCTHGVGTAYAPCNPVALHAFRLGASLMACCLSYDVRSLFRLRTSRLFQFKVHMAKCQVQKVARDALSMRNTVRSLTPGGWSKVAKVLEVPQTQFV